MDSTYRKPGDARHRATAWMLVAAVLCAPFAPAAGQTREEIPVRSGGIGTDERAEMQAARGDYNLRLAFATAGGAYVAKVQVTLYQQRDGSYHEIYAGSAEGPWFYARVAPGRYRVEATYRGATRTRELQVGTQQALTHIVMQWPAGVEDR